MRIAFAADDENECTRAVVAAIEESHELVRPTASTSWPSMSRDVAVSVVEGDCDYGVLMCWTGTGTAIAANKVQGARAATAADAWTAKNARLWNDANILALSLKRLAPEVAVECLQAFLAEPAPDPEEVATINALTDVGWSPPTSGTSR